MQKIDNERLAVAYLKAKHFIQESEYSNELTTYQKTHEITPNFAESDLLRETAWVILCSGFREKNIRHHFSYISLCFCDWESATEILAVENECYETTLSAFKHQQKIKAIIQVARIISEAGFPAVKQRILNNPYVELRQFPYIGDTTVFHLAKNLGFNVAKPDRHLLRIAKAAGFNDVQLFCKVIAGLTGDPVALVDLIFWRYAVIHGANQVFRETHSLC